MGGGDTAQQSVAPGSNITLIKIFKMSSPSPSKQTEVKNLSESMKANLDKRQNLANIIILGATTNISPTLSLSKILETLSVLIS